jgi:carboxyl-terminal processing protease
MRLRRAPILLVCTIAACTAAPTKTPPPPSRVAAPTLATPATAEPAPVSSERRALYRETFESVHAKIANALVDATAGTVDWKAVGAEFRGRVDEVADDGQFHALLSEMLGRLGKSHFGIIPPEAYTQEDEARESREPAEPSKPSEPSKTKGGEAAPDGGGASKEPEAPAKEPEAPAKEPDALPKEPEAPTKEPEAPTKEPDAPPKKSDSPRDGVIGAEVAIVEGSPTIASVVTDGPAQRAGLRPGFTILRVNETDLEALARRVALRSANKAWREHLLESAVTHSIAGSAGSTLTLRYADADEKPHEVTLTRVPEPRQEKASLGELPELEIRCEKRLLAGDVGYVRFNIFLMPLLPRVRAAVHSFRQAKGLILDLRGNPGGLGGMASGVAGLIARETGNLGTSRIRGGEVRFPVFKAPKPFEGPVAVLVDSGSASTSEILAAGLQECGRAVVVGTPSAGAVLLSVVEKLPTGARLQYAMGDFKTPRGQELEGVGVIPDLTVPLARSALLRGEDNVIEVARRLLAGP